MGSAHGVQTFHIECRETVTWIEDKKRVLEQTDELKMDLTGIMTLQVRMILDSVVNYLNFLYSGKSLHWQALLTSTQFQPFIRFQRKLSGMDRDKAAIDAKLKSLEEEANKIRDSHPEEAQVVMDRVNKLQREWQELDQMLRERKDKLEEAGDLHRFLKDLDHFQVNHRDFISVYSCQALTREVNFFRRG